MLCPGGSNSSRQQPLPAAVPAAADLEPKSSMQQTPSAVATTPQANSSNSGISTCVHDRATVLLVVLLGLPGAGKSTLAAALCRTAAQQGGELVCVCVGGGGGCGRGVLLNEFGWGWGGITMGWMGFPFRNITVGAGQGVRYCCGSARRGWHTGKQGSQCCWDKVQQ